MLSVKKENRKATDKLEVDVLKFIRQMTFRDVAEDEWRAYVKRNKKEEA